LDGQLEEFQNQIRLAAQLVDRRNGTLVWSQTFEKELQNPLELQSEIAQGVVDSLEHQFLAAPKNGGTGYSIYAAFALQLRRFSAMQLPKPPTTSNAAMEAYMRGEQLAGERTLPSLLSAVDYYHKAVNQDPNFALAYASLS
jgi:hypothetical protein